MLRRQARLRREYLYRKSLEGKERVAYEHKRAIKEALREGKSIPTELRHEEARLREELEFDGDTEPRNVMDDEYANAGVYDPKIMLTTSRDPSSRLLQFVKELKLIFPNSQRVNRGGSVLKELIDLCRANDVSDLIVVHEHRGEPDGLIVSHLPYGPTAYFGLSNCVLRHDIWKHDQSEKTTVSEAYPHLLFHGFSSKLGDRNILKFLFPPPKDESKRVITFANNEDFISFRHHNYEKEGHKNIDLKEIGPRFEMRPYQLRLGTLDQTEADTEWVLRPYHNSAKRRTIL